MPPTTPIGVLLLQLGTPDSTDVADVRRYLREFLSDPRVLDMPAPARWILLNAVILPFRPRRSAEAYEKIWTDRGSPLTTHTEELVAKLASELGEGYRVTYGMRYRRPSIRSAVEWLEGEGCKRIVVLPQFPQYASASTGSAVEEALRTISDRHNVPDICCWGDFYDDPGFIDAAAGVGAPILEEFRPDHVVFSYHGLPEKQIRKGDDTGRWCLQDGCCARVTEVNRFCYRAQCHETTRRLAERLDLPEPKTSTTFQSRLKGQKWIEPYTDHRLPELAASGVRRLAVLTPSFAADCLETLEEIGIRGRRQWADLGGTDFCLVPCVNADDRWVAALAGMVKTAW